MALIACVLFSFLMYRVNFQAQFWIIDDHEIAHFLGSTHRLLPSQFFEKLINETEVGRYGDFYRFRPVYFFFRLIESMVWGGQPALWYGFRIAIFTIFIFTFWTLAAKLIGYGMAGLITLSMATYNYWSDIVARLGPSEIYAALGLALIGLGIYTIYSSRKIRTGWLLTCLGYLICSGSKENFVVFILLLACIFWDLLRKKKLSVFVWAGMVISLLWTAWTLGAILIFLYRNAHDPYYPSASVSGRLSLIASSLEQISVITLISGCLLFIIVSLFLKRNNPEASRLFKYLGWGFAAGLLLYLSQMFFYDGSWPNGQRYDFPGLLVWPILSVMSVWTCSALLNQVHRVWLKISIRSAQLALVLIPLIFVLRGIAYAQSESSANVERSVNFQQRISQIITASKNNPRDVILIQTDRPDWDYEAVSSYMDFLRYNNIPVAIAFIWDGKPPSDYKGSKAIMAREMLNLSLEGNSLNLPVPSFDFTPLPQLAIQDDNCILVVVSGEPARDCAIVIDGSWK